MVVRQVKKYVVDREHADQLSKNISKIADHDKYAPEGSYIVRSLYFDDDKDTALKNREADVNGREKFRVRFYNNDKDYIKLEKKIKIDGIGTKTEAKITLDEAEKILKEDYDWMKDSTNDLIQEFYAKALEQGLKPRIIIEYMREPFEREDGIRITLDHYVKKGSKVEEFLDKDFTGDQLNDNISILEIKWPGDFPEFLDSALELDKFRQKDVSKYVISRKEVTNL